MNIGLVGYGRMGKEIERISYEYGMNVVCRFDVDNAIQNNRLDDVDVLVDFSEPSSTIVNMRYAVDNNIPIVVGVTGWYEKKEEMRDYIMKNAGSVIFGSNFSVGMNIMFVASRLISKLAYRSGIYDVALHEIHHTKKKDSPSGTAITLSDIVLSEFKGKNMKEFHPIDGTQIQEDVLHVSSQRIGKVIGEHTLLFDSECDSIRLEHSAKNREGFARGALLAAKWIKGQMGFFDFSEVFEEVVGA